MMETRIMTIRYDEKLGGFPEKGLQAMVADKKVSRINTHVFVHEGVPCLSVVLMLNDQAGEATDKRPSAEGRGREWPAEQKVDLTPEDMPLYQKLKAWRGQAAAKETKPLYAIARNVQLARIAKLRPRTSGELTSEAMMTEHFAEKYGAEVLQIVGLSTTSRDNARLSQAA